MPRAVLVIPCYNEELRLRPAAFKSFLGEFPDVDLLFVDDGSTDHTADVIASICADAPHRAARLQLAKNSGKAEAVRQGFLVALRSGAPFLGFWDADLATPLETVALFLDAFDHRPDLEIVLGSRVKLLGWQIERRPLRHYLGRVFATVVSIMLRLPVYDTQCGAKLFRGTPTLQAIFAAPFRTRWVFDVEILARLIVQRRVGGGPDPRSCVAELPLPVWRDVKGSKVRPRDFARVGRDLWFIHRFLQRNARPPEAAAGAH